MNHTTDFAAGHATTRNTFRAVLALLVACCCALLLGASSASAAFTPTSFSATPTNLQAAGHGNLDIKVGLDAASADQSGDDLSTLQIELPSGQLFNPQAVASSCSATQLRADSCPAASLIGTIMVKFRIFGAIRSAYGSVYMLPASADSPLNFGFAVRPSGLQKLFFQSSKVTGMTSVRQGLDADYGLTITIPQIPKYVKDGFGFQYAMTVSEIAISLNSKAPSGKYFVFNPTRCDAASARATLTSARGAAPSIDSAYVPTGCDAVPFDPYVLVQPTSSIAAAPTGVKATFEINTADATIQRSHMDTISATLPGGTMVDLTTLNSIGLCSDEALAAAACPADSQIGTANVDVPLLSTPMTGGIFLTSRSDGVQYGVVITGPNGTNAIFRGIAMPTADGIRATFSGLPQAPYRSAILEFTSKIVVNPAKACPTTFTQIDAVGYNGTSAAIASMVNLTGCVPNTTITVAPPALTRTKKPSFSFTSDMSNATFKCRIDSGTWDPCVSPYVSPTSLTDGLHRFDVRAFYGTTGDFSPATKTFTVDTVAPIVNVTSPLPGATIYEDSITLEWTSDDGVSAKCALDATGLEDCESGKTYSDLAPGEYSLFVSVRDAAGNYRPTWLSVTVAPAPNPVVNITKPVDGETTEFNGLEAVFTATSPIGSAITTNCELEQEWMTDEYYTVRDFPCSSGDKLYGLDTGDALRLKVTATDSEGRTGEAYAKFVVGVRDPATRHVTNGPESVATDDRTPTFFLDDGADPLYPVKVDECAFFRPGDTSPNWVTCSPTEDSYTSPTELEDGNWVFGTRSSSGTRMSSVARTSFEVKPWAPTYTATASTTAAGAHPDLDVDIEVPSGQLRKVDMTLPRGMIGSLNSAAECPLETIPTPRLCAEGSKVGVVEVRLVVFGLNIRPLDGTVYLTEPQVPGDAAGLVIIVPGPLDGFEDVVIPLRLQLLQNAAHLRVFSDSIPTQVMQTDVGLADYFVENFKMHVDGSKGSPFPLLSNPTNCSAGNFSTVIGSLSGSQSDPLARPFQATGCDSLPFAPTVTQQFGNLKASTDESGETSNVVADVTLPASSSALSSIVISEPALAAPNFASFGEQRDQCSPGSISDSDPSAAVNLVFRYTATACPESARIGTVTVSTPLLKDPLVGQVYWVNRSPLPWFGVSLDNDRFKLNLVGVITTERDALGLTHVTVKFNNIPDVPLSTVNFALNLPDRIGKSGQVISGNLLEIGASSDPVCVPGSPAVSTVTNQAGAQAVLSQPIDFIGCAPGQPE